MSLEVVALSTLLRNFDEHQVQILLDEFKSRDFSGKNEAHEVEDFLKNKAIYYDKNDFSKTHLVYSDYQGEKVLVGYYAVGINSLNFSTRQLNKYSSKIRGQLKNKATKKDKTTGNIELTCYLIGQIGKNFSEDALKTNAITGFKLLDLAYQTILEAQELTGGSFAYLEYEDTDKLREIYKKFGFKELVDYRTQNGLCMAILRIK